MSQPRLLVIGIALLFALAGCDTTGPQVQEDTPDKAQTNICVGGDNCLPGDDPYDPPDYAFDAYPELSLHNPGAGHTASGSMQVYGVVDVVAYTDASELADDISVSASVVASGEEGSAACSPNSSSKSKSDTNTGYVEVRFSFTCVIFGTDASSSGKLTFSASSTHYAAKDGESVSYTRSATAYDLY